MDFLVLAAKRKSVRSFCAQPVEETKLKLVLEAARLAPSANNRQPWKLIVVTDERLRKQLAQVADQEFVGEAPVVIVAVALEPERMMYCQVPPYAVDVAIAIDHITLAAAACDLGTCWIGHFDQDQTKQLLNIPDKYKVVALLPLGYPQVSQSKPKKRKPLDDLVLSDRWS